MKSYNTTVTEGQPLNKSLEFIARAVLVDNITSSWIWVPGGGRFVPPFQHGVIITLEGTAQGNISWQTPVGISVPTAGSATAQVTFVEAELPPSNGTPAVVPISQTIPLPVLTVVTPPTGIAAAKVGDVKLPLAASGNNSGTYTLTLPAATESVMVLMSQLAASTTSQKVNVTGTQTGALYGSLTLSGTAAGTPPQYVEVVTGADTSLTVTITWVSGAPNVGDFVELIAMPFPGVLPVQQQPGASAFTTNVTQEAGLTLVQGGAAGTAQTSFPTAPGPSTNIQTAVFGSVVASGGNVNLIPADGSLRSVYLGRLHLSSEGAVGTLPVIALRATLATDLAQFAIPGTVPAILAETTFDYARVAFNGQTINLVNIDSVSHTLRGFVTWQWW